MKSKRQVMNKTNKVYSVPFIVEDKTIIQDDNGIEKETWKKKYKLYADGKNLYGNEYELAKQYSNRKTIKFIIKYGPKITEKMRIIFQGKIYDIDNIDNIGFKNELLEIRAIERVLENE